MNTSKNLNNKVKTVNKTNGRCISSIVNKRFIYAIIILIIVYILFAFIYKGGQKYRTINVSNMTLTDKKPKSQAAPLNDFYTLKELKRDDSNLKCSIYIPNTKDEKLNKYIEINMEEYILNIRSLIKGKNLGSQKATLDIFFDTYLGTNRQIYIVCFSHICGYRSSSSKYIYMVSSL